MFQSETHGAFCGENTTAFLVSFSPSVLGSWAYMDIRTGIWGLQERLLYCCHRQPRRGKSSGIYIYLKRRMAS